MNLEKDQKGAKIMTRINKVALALMVAFTPTVLASEGLYAGVGIGSAFTQVDVDRGTDHHMNYTSNAGKVGTGLGAFLGYNHLIKETPLFIGLEAGFHYHNIKMSLKQDHRILYIDKMDVSSTDSLSGVFKFGVVIKDLMVHAKAGLLKTTWRLGFEGSHPKSAYKGLVKTNSYGSVYGFGADYKLNSNWSIGLDHTINTFQSLEFKIAEGSVKVDPKINTTSLRLTYTF